MINGIMRKFGFISGRRAGMTGNITAIIILLLMWAYYSGKWGDGEGG